VSYLQQLINQDQMVGLKLLLVYEFWAKKFDLCAVISLLE
jgi:hypothetical protein